MTDSSASAFGHSSNIILILEIILEFLLCILYTGSTSSIIYIRILSGVDGINLPHLSDRVEYRVF